MDQLFYASALLYALVSITPDESGFDLTREAKPSFVTWAVLSLLVAGLSFTGTMWLQMTQNPLCAVHFPRVLRLWLSVLGYDKIFNLQKHARIECLQLLARVRHCRQDLWTELVYAR